MKYLREDRKLFKVEIHNQGNTWTLQWPGGYKVFNGSPEDFRKYLVKIKASDSETLPKSTRQKKYKDIVDDILKGRTRHVWVWRHKMKEMNFGPMVNPRFGSAPIRRTVRIKYPMDTIKVGDTFIAKREDERGFFEIGDEIKILRIERDRDFSKYKNFYVSVNGRPIRDDVSSELEFVIGERFGEKGSKTAKCPDCGNKYLVQTGYCVTCKKKVKEKKKETIEIVQEFQIPGTDIVLEKGDKILVKESWYYDIDEVWNTARELKRSGHSKQEILNTIRMEYGDEAASEIRPDIESMFPGEKRKSSAYSALETTYFFLNFIEKTQPTRRSDIFWIIERHPIFYSRKDHVLYVDGLNKKYRTVESNLKAYVKYGYLNVVGKDYVVAQKGYDFLHEHRDLYNSIVFDLDMDKYIRDMNRYMGH